MPEFQGSPCFLGCSGDLSGPPVALPDCTLQEGSVCLPHLPPHMAAIWFPHSWRLKRLVRIPASHSAFRLPVFSLKLSSASVDNAPQRNPKSNARKDGQPGPSPSFPLLNKTPNRGKEKVVPCCAGPQVEAAALQERGHVGQGERGDTRFPSLPPAFPPKEEAARCQDGWLALQLREGGGYSNS